VAVDAYVTSYAKNFVLQDHMFQPNASWSLPEHLFQVSGWSADCASHDPASCTNSDMPTPRPPGGNPVDLPTKDAMRGQISPICCIARMFPGRTTW
jgi:phospholipase C